MSAAGNGRVLVDDGANTDSCPEYTIKPDITHFAYDNFNLRLLNDASSLMMDDSFNTAMISKNKSQGKFEDNQASSLDDGTIDPTGHVYQTDQPNRNEEDMTIVAGEPVVLGPNFYPKSLVTEGLTPAWNSQQRGSAKNQEAPPTIIHSGATRG